MNKRDSAKWVRWTRPKALKQFGVLPPGLQATRHAYVTVTRVMGPRERPLDSVENFRFACKGLTDALKRPPWGGGYIVDDADRWATFSFMQDETRRDQGPRVEIDIRYGHPPTTEVVGLMGAGLPPDEGER